MHQLRELRGLALYFLQQQKVRLRAAEPISHQPLPHADGVHVPGGDTHQSMEKLVPQPQADVALGFFTTKWLPINSSV